MRRRWCLLLVGTSCASLLARDATFFRDTKARDLFTGGRTVLTMTFLDRRPTGGLRLPYHTPPRRAIELSTTSRSTKSP